MFDHIHIASDWAGIHIHQRRWLNIGELFRVFSMYRKPKRHYHTVKHIADCLSFIDHQYAGSNPDVIDRVKMAVIYHDCIYEIGAQDNEEKSAIEWLSHSVGFPDDFRQEVAHLIRMTKTHKLADGWSAADAMMNDADMHIFVRPPEDYLEYARGIWREYSAVGREAYLAGRINFLETLDAKTIFYTGEMSDETHIAEQNIQTELKILKTHPEIILGS